MDQLSDVLSLLRPRSAISAGLDAGGDWAIRFPPHEGVKFNAVMRGACWVRVEGEAEPRRIEAGDCFLLTRGRPFLFATDLALPPIDSPAIYGRAMDGIATCNGGGDFFLIGGRFAFEGDHAGLLFGALPAIVHVRDASSQAAVLRWALDQLAMEIRDAAPGQTLMAEPLAQIMLVQVLRLWLATASGTSAGWLGALSDPRLARAIGAMHGEPGRRWTIAAMADHAGMSRTSSARPSDGSHLTISPTGGCASRPIACGGPATALRPSLLRSAMRPKRGSVRRSAGSRVARRRETGRTSRTDVAPSLRLWPPQRCGS